MKAYTNTRGGRERETDRDRQRRDGDRETETEKSRAKLFHHKDKLRRPFSIQTLRSAFA